MGIEFDYNSIPIFFSFFLILGRFATIIYKSIFKKKVDKSQVLWYNIIVMREGKFTKQTDYLHKRNISAIH